MGEPSRLLGKTLGHFRALAVLGEGGMGVVYRAFDERLRRPVALKVLPEESMKSEDRRRRFLHEARAAAAITHAHVATVHDVGEADGHVYIAMELVEGTTLHDLLRRGRIEPPEVVRIARAITRALAKAHEKGIIHRDLKPENVMLNEDGEVKVLDFGLAKLLGEGDRGPSSKSILELEDTQRGMTAEGRILGTPYYMSPEQATGLTLDPRTDLFSLGAVMYEMLTGTKAFPGDSPVAVLSAVTRDAPPPLRRLLPGIAPELENVVETLLQKEREKRYSSARAVAIALELLDGGRGSMSLPTFGGASRSLAQSAPKDSPAKRPSRRPQVVAKGRALRRGAAVAGGAALVLAVAAAFTMRRSRSSEESPTSSASAPPGGRARVPEAEALVARAAKEEREGRHDLACADATRASDLDATFGEAHLVAALCRRAVPREGRPYFRRAWAARDGMPAADAALVYGLEPVYQREPEDDDEEVRRLRQASSRFPDDSRIHFVFSRALRHVGEDAEANVEMARTLALDPKQPFALELHSDYLAYDGELSRAKEAIGKCLDLAPSAVGCLLELAWIQGQEGECDDLEVTARRMIAIDPNDDDAARVLANAVYAQGHPTATSRELLRRVSEREPDESDTRFDAIHLAILDGDFAQAEKLVRAERETVAKSVVASEHAVPDQLLVSLLRETRRDAEAAAIAREYLEGRDAWDPEGRLEDWALAHEPTPLMIQTRLRAGAITAAQASDELATTLKRWSARIERTARPFMWIYGYAVPAETRADAEAALAALPSYGGLPPYKPLSLVDESIGRTYLLAGRTADARATLEHAARSCFQVDHPIEHTRAELWLGEAREAQGDVKGACEAYAVVTKRWGRVPRSITAAEAARRAGALGCPKG
jgi:serine/threonine-protein kinase